MFKIDILSKYTKVNSTPPFFLYLLYTIKKQKKTHTMKTAKTTVKEMSKNAKEDLILVEAIKAGDKKAFDKVFKKYHDYLLFQFRIMIKDEDDARELVLDAFVKMNFNLEKFDSKNSAFSTWFFKLTKNIFIDNLRKKRNQECSISSLSYNSDVLEDDSQSITDFLFKSDDVNPETKLMDREQNKKMNEVIDSLENKNLIDAIKMRYYENMSYDEIADVMGTTSTNVKTYIFRAKEVLKKELKEIGIVYFPYKKN
jgi:RNA polymerase sigma-70 factor (ECF subfamily)